MNDHDDLTDDGVPIGEVAVSNGTAVVRWPESEREKEVEANRQALIRQEVTEITGSDSSDDAMLELYEGYDDPDLRKQALRKYIIGREPLQKIADDLNIPVRTVSMWAFVGCWDRVLKREIQAEQEHSMLMLVKYRNLRRASAAVEQLDAAREVRQVALDKLRTDDISVKSAADALKSVADVEARVLGISESGALDRGEKTEAEKSQATGGKQLLVVNFNGELPPIHVEKH